MHENRVSPVRLHTFGTPRLERVTATGVEPIQRAGKPLALLIYLAAFPGRTFGREHLADLLWGDESPDNARASLRQATYTLRQSLGEGVFLTDRDSIRLVPGSVSSDCDDFLEASRRGDLRGLLAFLTGPFCALPLVSGASEFERWVHGERLRFDTIFVTQSINGLPDLVTADRDAARALALGLTTRFPDRSDVAVASFDALVRAEALSEAAERLATHHARLVAEDLPVPPGIRERLARMRRSAGARRVDPLSGVASIGREFVGRDALMQDLLRLAEASRDGLPQRALLVGPAGVGKTRILDELEARLRMGGDRVQRVEFLPGMADLQYIGVTEVVRTLGRLPGALGVSEQSARRLMALVPELAQQFTAPARAGAIHDGGIHTISAAVEDLMAAVSEDRVVVLLLDNLQFADAASRRVLAGAARRSGSRLLTVGTSRLLGAEVFDESGATTIEVLPLAAEHLRTLLTAVAALPDDAWVDAFVEIVHQRSRGMPQLALGAVRSLSAAGLLEVVDGRWRSSDREALLRMARESAGTQALVEGLDATSRLILEVLAMWGRPMPEADVLGCLSYAEPPVAVEPARARLLAMEALGLVQLREQAWRISHDTIADEVRRVPAPVQPVRPHELLLRLFGRAERLTVSILEHLAFVAGREHDPMLAGDVVLAGGRATALRVAGLRGPALAARVVRAAGHPEWERGLRQRLGFLGRRTEPERIALSVTATLAVAALMIVLVMLQPRLVVESEPMAGHSEREFAELAVQPRLAIINGFGRRLTLDLPIRVRADNGKVFGDTAPDMIRGSLQFRNLALAIHPTDSIDRPVSLRFDGPWYVRRVTSRVRGSGTTYADEDFRVISLTVNGIPVPDSLVITAKLSDSLRFDLTFEYTTVWPTANYVLGAIPLWQPRETGSIRLAGLPRPVSRAWRSLTFAVSPPPTAGEQYLVFMMDAEESVQHMFSFTNWTAGAPRWYDGNDIHDQPRATLETLRRGERVTVSGLQVGRFVDPLGQFRAGSEIIGGGTGTVTEATNSEHRVLGRALRIRFVE